jgi:hypothetical protein
MSNCLPDFPRYIRQFGNNEWQGANHPDGPWRPIPAPQSGMPWPTDGPAVRSREPASVAADASPSPPPPDTDLALRVQRLEAMRETEKAALLDAFRQIDDLKQRLDFQYWKLCKLEELITPDAND